MLNGLLPVCMAERTEEELELIVDEGVTIKDVIIEHPVYGDLTAAIRVSTRKEVKQFMNHINSTNAAYLSQLTEGVHLHTLSAPTKERIDQACQALDEAGILIKIKKPSERAFLYGIGLICSQKLDPAAEGFHLLNGTGNQHLIHRLFNINNKEIVAETRFCRARFDL